MDKTTVETFEIEETTSDPKAGRLTRTVFISLVFFVLGFTIGIPGPTLLDLQIAINGTLHETALIVPIRAVGTLFGCIVAGFVPKQTNIDKLLLFGMAGISVSLGIIPWTRSWSTLAAATFTTGGIEAFLEVFVNVYNCQMWQNKAGVTVQAVYMFLGLGLFSAPMLAAPFLVRRPHHDFDSNINNTEVQSVGLYITAYNVTACNGTAYSESQSNSTDQNVTSVNVTSADFSLNSSQNGTNVNGTERNSAKAGFTKTEQDSGSTNGTSLEPTMLGVNVTNVNGTIINGTNAEGSIVDVNSAGTDLNATSAGNYTAEPSANGTSVEQTLNSTSVNSTNINATSAEVNATIANTTSVNITSVDQNLCALSGSSPLGSNSTEIHNETRNETHNETEATATVDQLRIQYTYDIVAAFGFVIVFTFAILNRCFPYDILKEKEKAESMKLKNISTSRILIVLGLACLVVHLQFGLLIAFGTMLEAYVVEGSAHMTKENAAYLTSAFWGAYAFGRTAALILVIPLGAYNVLILEIIVTVLGSVALYFDSDETMLWLACVLTGIGLSAVFGLVLSYLQEYIQVESKFVSVLITACMVGEFAYPLLIAEVIEDNFNNFVVVNNFGIGVLCLVYAIFALVCPRLLKENKCVHKEVTKL